jgi:carbon-monoxide dehydrogenase small subunit
MRIDLTLRVNGDRYQLAVDPRRTLLEVLREELGLTGTKLGCSYGVCGACTVIVDGKAMNACLVLAPQADGADVLTIEGVARDGELHPVQSAFVSQGAFQCGFCTPGFVMSAYALLDEQPDASDEDLRRALVGNLCRCTGYLKYLAAIRTVASALREARP